MNRQFSPSFSITIKAQFGLFISRETQRIISFVRWWRWLWKTTRAVAAEYTTARRRQFRRKVGNSGKKWKCTMKFSVGLKIPATKKLCNLASMISFGITSTVFLHGHFPIASLLYICVFFTISLWMFCYFYFLWLLLSEVFVVDSFVLIVNLSSGIN